MLSGNKCRIFPAWALISTSPHFMQWRKFKRYAPNPIGQGILFRLSPKQYEGHQPWELPVAVRSSFLAGDQVKAHRLIVMSHRQVCTHILGQRQTWEQHLPDTLIRAWNEPKGRQNQVSQNPALKGPEAQGGGRGICPKAKFSHWTVLLRGGPLLIPEIKPSCH